MDISIATRERIVALHLHTSKTQREIGEAVKVSQKTVCRIIKLFEETGSVQPRRKGKCGRKRSTTDRDNKIILRISLMNPHLTANDIKMQQNISASHHTVARRLREGGRYARKPIKKPLLTKKMRSQRLKWSKDHKNWTVNDWKSVSI